MDNATTEKLKAQIDQTMNELKSITNNVMPKVPPKNIRLRIGLFKKQAKVFLSQNNILRIEFDDPKDGENFFNSLK